MKTKSKIDQAPKYVLCFDGVLCLSEKQGLTGVNLTDNINEAQVFAYGFDDPDQKKQIWSMLLKRKMNNSNVEFSIKNL